MERCSKAGCVLFRFNVESALTSNFRPALARNALIDSDTVQPGRNLCFAAKPAQIAKRRQKGLLRGVARIFFAAEHAKGKRENASLPARYDFAESLCVARQGTLHDLFVARSFVLSFDLAVRRFNPEPIPSKEGCVSRC